MGFIYPTLCKSHFLMGISLMGGNAFSTLASILRTIVFCCNSFQKKLSLTAQTFPLIPLFTEDELMLVTYVVTV